MWAIYCEMRTCAFYYLHVKYVTQNKYLHNKVILHGYKFNLFIIIYE